LIFSANILAYKYIHCAAATPPAQFGAVKARGRSNLR